jgi:hypothetical protein
MDNVLANLESQVAPAAIAAGASEGLKTGHMNYGKELFDLYVGDDSKDTMVKAIIRMASALTCEQFRAECEKAQEIATSTDAACGFKAPEGAKGTEKYGPKRRTINTRLSEAKQIFGCAKLDLSKVIERGYWSALQSAKDTLGEKGLKWDGQKAPTKEQRAAQRDNKESLEAFALAQKILPQHAGESIKQWTERVAIKAEALKEQMLVDDLVEKIKNLHPDVSYVMNAVFEYIKDQGPDIMEDCGKQLIAEAVEIRADQDKKAASAS